MRKTDFVESYFDAWNHRDSRGIAGHLSADGTYRDVPENLQRSQDELIVSLDQFFAVYHHRYELIGEVLKNGNTVAFQYRMFPLGKKTAREASVTWQGAEFITLYDGAAMTIVDYYDVPVEPLVNKYAKSGLAEEQLLEYKHRLDQIMRLQQLFLTPDLTLPKLAETVDCSVNHLSQVINSGFGMSFFDYLNRYRIEHARELLARPGGQGDAILNVAFTVGFNSNSAFYAAFKKYVGQTPAQYRQDQLSKSH